MPAFRDAPIVKEASDPAIQIGWTRAHLSGTMPVVDLQAFMENDTDGIAFVVFRTVKCSEASVLMARAGDPLRWTEAIYTKSKSLKKAMQKIATCYFQPVTEEKSTSSYFDNLSKKPSGDINSPFARNQIDPADLFLFHHRDLLKSYALEYLETKQHINALLEYTDKRFGAEFAEANSLFARGIVDQEHILYLFKPNELIISGTYGKPAAFVLQEWPKLSSTGWVTLPCWSFQTDGSGFARKLSYLSVLPIEAKTMRIQDLAAYPLRFATQELQELIRSRGEKHWDLRTATQITYKGWNVARDQFFVSPGHVLFTVFAEIC